MEFEWDEEKRQATLKERGVDLLYAALIFEGKTLTREDNREDYGEVRFASLRHWVWLMVRRTPSFTPSEAKTYA
ncbi:BrnT family toxin [Rhodophyticola sp. CCM32]|uniref:BrnT family toxin n=1 Tax=Rhodophyticola sp. CCM32 TaxID=2916397 RepID=UPI001AEF5528|nr:BrnT family toxin [Rhodophyticola sp. CCM32]